MTLLRALLLVLLASTGAVAHAQDGAMVRVQVTDREARPSEATVTLTPREGGTPRECVTRNGSCEIAGVPAGSYVVSAVPRGEGRSPIPRVVPVPERVPSIELRVRLL